MRTVVGNRIKAALVDYGGYLVDDTADNRVTICMEKEVNEELRLTYNIDMAFPHGLRPNGGSKEGRELYADLLVLFRALHIVSNNSPTSVGGGGAPRRPLAPSICTN